MTLDWLDFFIVFGSGCLAGFINTLAGGGSLLTLPVLIFMGLPPALANGTNRVGILMQNAFAVWGFRSKGVSSFPYAFWIAASAMVGAFIGARVAIDIRGELFNRILAVVMLVVLFVTIFNPFKGRRDQLERLGIKHQVIVIVSFFFLGIYGGFIQAGIGFIMMATLVSVNRISLVKVNSIKVFVVLVYTALALGVFAYEGQVNWLLGLVLAAGTSIGGWTASRWSANKGDRWIRYFLIAAVSAMSIKLWFF